MFHGENGQFQSDHTPHFTGPTTAATIRHVRLSQSSLAR